MPPASIVSPLCLTDEVVCFPFPTPSCCHNSPVHRTLFQNFYFCMVLQPGFPVWGLPVVCILLQIKSVVVTMYSLYHWQETHAQSCAAANCFLLIQELCSSINKVIWHFVVLANYLPLINVRLLLVLSAPLLTSSFAWSFLYLLKYRA